jgi:hypothetical protein
MNRFLANILALAFGLAALPAAADDMTDWSNCVENALKRAITQPAGAAAGALP